MSNELNSDRPSDVWDFAGLPSEIRTDNGTEWASSAFKDLLQSFGIQPGPAAPAPLSDRRSLR
jgi:hypothetical protein